MGELFRSACRHMLRRRARTRLTVGGILVGVLMVALTAVIGQAGTTAAQRELTDMGLRGVSVGTSTPGAGLTATDLGAVRATAGVSEAMPLLLTPSTGEMRQYSGAVYAAGIDAGSNQVFALETAHGRLFHTGDIQAAANVCVIDEKTAIAACGRSDAVGQTFTLTIGKESLSLTVVGIAKAGSSLLQGVSGYLPTLVFVPYTTLQATVGGDLFTQIAVQVQEEGETDAVRASILQTLERTNGVSGLYTAEDLAAQRGRLSHLMDIVHLILLAVSAVSLLVAGMGMMTSMLTAVNERVREIGIRQALGAGRGRVLAEFLTESALVAALGGAIGVALGALCGAVGLTALGLPVTLPWGRFALLWGAAVLLGCVFGWYPARRAAAMCPAEALRAND